MKRRLFNLFRNDFMKYAFDEQSKPVDFAKLDMKFVDANGKRYYAYRDDFDIPVLRKGKLEQLIIELGSGMSGDELEKFFDKIEEALDQGQARVAEIGFLIKEMRSRKEMLIHPEILFEMVATLYIREDENPAEVDEEIHLQKFNQLKQDSKGGLYDFFYSAGIGTYVPYLTKLEADWNTYWNEASTKIQGMEQMLNKMNGSHTSDDEFSRSVSTIGKKLSGLAKESPARPKSSEPTASSSG